MLVQSLAFWLSTGGVFTSMAINAIVTFAIYPIILFIQTAKVVLVTIGPAAFMGAVARPGSSRAFPGQRSS